MSTTFSRFEDSTIDSTTVVAMASLDPDKRAKQRELRSALGVFNRDPKSFAGHGRWTDKLLGRLARKPLVKLNVNLTVDGVGTVDLPLQEAQAQEIIKQARPAARGQGKAWELDSDYFSLTGDAGHWTKLRHKALRMVFNELEVYFNRDHIVAIPDKMLLYEKGAYVQACTDVGVSRKIPNMFGTMTIGGDVIVKYKEAVKAFATGTSIQQPPTKKDFSFMAWYKQAQHEVKPISAGYRWVLTYHLTISESAGNRPLPKPPAALSRLTCAVRSWLSTLEAEVPMLQAAAAAVEAEAVRAEEHAKTAEAMWATLKARKPAEEYSDGEYPAEVTSNSEMARHEAEERRKLANDASHPSTFAQHVICNLVSPYDEEDLWNVSLKDRGLHTLNALISATSDIPVDVFYCLVQKRTVGSCEDSYGPYRQVERLSRKWSIPEDHPLRNGQTRYHHLDTVFTTEYTIELMTDLKGVPLARFIEIDSDVLLQKTFYCWKENQVHFDADHDDECAVAVHEDKSGGLVIVPRSSLQYLLCSAIHDKSGWYSSPVFDDNFQSLTAYYTKNSMDPTNKQNRTAFGLLKSLCRHAWKLKPPPKDTMEVWHCGHARTTSMPTLRRYEGTYILCAAVRMRDWAFFDEVITQVKGNFVICDLFYQVSEEIYCNKTNPLAFSRARKSLYEAAVSVQNLRDALIIIQILAPPRHTLLHGSSTASNPDKVDETWGQEVFDCVLHNLIAGQRYVAPAAHTVSVGYIDGKELFTHCLSFYGMTFVQTRLQQHVKSLTHHTGFMLGFLHEVAERTSLASSPAQAEPWLQMFIPLAKAAVTRMKMSSVPGTRASPLLCNDAGVQSGKAVKNDQLFIFFCQLQVLGKEMAKPELCGLAQDMLDQMADVLGEYGTSSSTNDEIENLRSAVKNYWLPFAEMLVFCPHLDYDDNAYVTRSDPRRVLTPFQNLVTNIIGEYIDLQLENYPRATMPLYRPPLAECNRIFERGRPCRLCSTFSKFLTNRKQASFRTTMRREYRLHLQNQIRAHKTSCQIKVVKRSSKRYTYEDVTVNKTWTKYEERHKEWEKNRDKVDKALQKAFPQRILSVVLPTAQYRKLVYMECLKIPQAKRKMYALFGESSSETTSSVGDKEAVSSGPKQSRALASRKRKRSSKPWM
ncbi:hypothetical protein SBRCBS47491_000895 [Sporothrix bragantina]|uniref:Uncharacterized protein n=1 Tax=Sporothrix bragantina TaxID=671064 RepID=A0ABP0AU42_9PEZI